MYTPVCCFQLTGFHTAAGGGLGPSMGPRGFHGWRRCRRTPLEVSLIGRICESEKDHTADSNFSMWKFNSKSCWFQKGLPRSSRDSQNLGWVKVGWHFEKLTIKKKDGNPRLSIFFPRVTWPSSMFFWNEFGSEPLMVTKPRLAIDGKRVRHVGARYGWVDSSPP